MATGDLEDQPGVDKRGTITAFMTRRVDEGSDVTVESAAGSSLAAVPVESAAEPLDAAEPSAKKRGRPAALPAEGSAVAAPSAKKPRGRGRGRGRGLT